MSELKEKVISEIKKIYDPEIPVNIYELGLIYKIDIDKKNKVNVEMTLTSPNCPVAESLPNDVKNNILKVEGVSDVDLKLDKEKNITDMSFEGEGCAISLASASILTDTLKGKGFSFTKKITEDFLNMVKNKTKITLNSLTEDQITTITSLSGVQEFPMRVKCATMVWHTLLSALDNKKLNS